VCHVFSWFTPPLLLHYSQLDYTNIDSGDQYAFAPAPQCLGFQHANIIVILLAMQVPYPPAAPPLFQ
jgi:hypothetical protein